MQLAPLYYVIILIAAIELLAHLLGTRSFDKSIIGTVQPIFFFFFYFFFFFTILLCSRFLAVLFCWWFFILRDLLLLFSLLGSVVTKDRVPTHPWKSLKLLEFFLLNSRPWEYLKTRQVLESPWISFHRSLKVLEFTKSNYAISATSLNNICIGLECIRFTYKSARYFA